MGLNSEICGSVRIELNCQAAIWCPGELVVSGVERPRTTHALFHITLTMPLLAKYYYYAHCTGVEPEAQRG